MITRHLVPSDWLDPLYDQTELHFHASYCHHEFHKLEDRAKEAARVFLKQNLPLISKVIND